MQIISNTRRTLRTRPVQWALTALSLAALAACGGGGVGTDATGLSASPSVTKSVVAGVVSGFGSVISNNVRFDVSGAQLVDDNGTSTTCAANDDCGLKMGMEVEIEGGAVATSTDTTVTPTAKATKINYGSSLLGPVTSITADQWVVLGQKVNLTSATVIDGTATAGTSVVEVHGLLDKTTGEIAATRIEVKSTPPAAYRLRGKVTEINTATLTAKVGGELVLFSDSGVRALFDALTNDQFIRVKLAVNKNADGQWVAQAVKSSERKLGSADNGAHSELEGVIDPSFALAADGTASFKLNGSDVTVPATGVTYERGVAADLKAGARVEVEGTVVNGVLQATKVQFKLGVKPSERAAAEAKAKEGGKKVEDLYANNLVEFHGTLTVNMAAKTLVITNGKVTTTFDFSDVAAVVLPSGSNLTELLAATGKVEVKGYLMADGKTYKLVRIKLDN